MLVKKGTIRVNKLLEQSLSTENFIFELTSNNIIKIKEKPISAVQKQYITGKITDDTNLPLIGVTILIKGTRTGTVSNFDGDYKIKIPNRFKKVVLTYSYIGYKTQEITVETQSIINVEMVPDFAQIEEVVVIGYGTVKKKDLTGAVSSLSKGIIEASNATSIGSMIQGQLPGVSILSGTSEPGSSVRIRIRGEASLTGGSNPLIVVDGVAMDEEFNLNDINPNDVASLDVLKVASAAAIYGSRAAAGVLEITTIKGTKYAKPMISYDTNIGFQTLEKEFKGVSTAQFKMLYEEGLVNTMRGQYNLRGDDQSV
jgi:TonB-dependent SusC/RagA subfamily outer membrane receptor